MNEQQRLFLVQARSNFAVFQILREQGAIHSCHKLHYLQMATEMLGKACAWKTGPKAGTHRAFVGFLKGLVTNRQAQQLLGFEGRNENWKYMIRKSIPIAEKVEGLAPALSLDTENSEYPWPRDMPTKAPAEHLFAIWTDLEGAVHGRQFLKILADLFRHADRFL